MRRNVLVSACLWVALAHAAAAQTYKGIDLYTVLAQPNNSLNTNIPGYAVGGQVVGHGAMVWNSPTGASVDLSSNLHLGGAAVGVNTSYSSTFQVSGTDGASQVGSISTARYGSSGGFNPQGWGPTYYYLGTSVNALLWKGTPDSAVDLNPPGFASSSAVGVRGSQQVGSATGQGTHAGLWNGSAASFVDLNPVGFNTSYADATDGVHQVGDGYPAATGNSVVHALLWNGTANSAVDLHPTNLSGFNSSFAYGVGGSQQVGYGSGTGTGYSQHALLWTGTADSAVDLNPSGFTASYAYGTDGTLQVGYGIGADSALHALLWRGTSASVVDLNALLPSGFISSQADSIDANGNLYGIAIDAAGRTHAVEWTGVPEPTAQFQLTVGGLILGFRHFGTKFRTFAVRQ